MVLTRPSPAARPVQEFADGDASGEYRWYEFTAPWTPTPSQLVVFRLGGFGQKNFKAYPVVKAAYLDRIEIRKEQ